METIKERELSKERREPIWDTAKVLAGGGIGAYIVSKLGSVTLEQVIEIILLVLAALIIMYGIYYLKKRGLNLADVIDATRDVVIRFKELLQIIGDADANNDSTTPAVVDEYELEALPGVGSFIRRPADYIGVYRGQVASYSGMVDAAYIPDIDKWLAGGGKIVKGIRDDDDLLLYSTNGLQDGDFFSYRTNEVVSFDGTAFEELMDEKKQKEAQLKMRAIAVFQELTHRQVYGNEYDTVIKPWLEQRAKEKGLSYEELINKYYKE